MDKITSNHVVKYLNDLKKTTFFSILENIEYAIFATLKYTFFTFFAILINFVCISQVASINDYTIDSNLKAL